MLCSVMISTFTALVASRLMLCQLETELHRAVDRVRVGAVLGSTSARWAREARFDFRRFDDLDEQLDAAKSQAIRERINPLLPEKVRGDPPTGPSGGDGTP